MRRKATLEELLEQVAELRERFLRIARGRFTRETRECLGARFYGDLRAHQKGPADEAADHGLAKSAFAFRKQCELLSERRCLTRGENVWK
jgi:hypothetical protein